MKGGLGNQLFQAAKVHDLISAGVNVSVNSYLLKKYDSPRNLEVSQLLDAIGAHVTFQPRLIRSKIAKLLSNFHIYTFGYNAYWQDIELSKNYIELVRSIYLKCSPGTNQYEGPLIHIRGGDYRKVIPHYENYLGRFLSTARDQIDFTNALVCTDDVPFSVAILEQLNCAIPINSTLRFEDLTRFSTILSPNSTFSWWAGVVGEAHILSPKSWPYERGWKLAKNEEFI